MKNTATIQVLRSNPLSDSNDETIITEHIPSEFSLMVKGERKRYFMRDRDGKPLSEREVFIIAGQRTFNLDDEVCDGPNFKMIRALVNIEGYESLKSALRFIIPNEDAEAEIKKVQREVDLNNTLMAHATDADWLGKVYRRVVGLASGIAPRTLLAELLKKVKEDSRIFIGKDGKYIFQDDAFDTRALLDLAIEKRVILKDGDYYRTSDDRVIAHDEAKAIYELQTNTNLRTWIELRVGQEDIAPVRPEAVVPEFSEALLNGLGESMDDLPVDETGAIDEAAVEARKTIELTDMVDKLISMNVITESKSGESVQYEIMGEKFSGIPSVVDFLSKNENLADNFRQMLI
jgi:hypothetical protein